MRRSNEIGGSNATSRLYDEVPLPRNRRKVNPRISKQLWRIQKLLNLSFAVFVLLLVAFVMKLDFSVPRKKTTQIIDISSKMNVCTEKEDNKSGATISKKNQFETVNLLEIN